MKTSEQNYCILLIYVDDIIITSTSNEMIDGIYQKINQNFEIRDLGRVKHYLGLEVIQDKNGVYSINQEKYIKEIVAEFGLCDAKGSKIPMEPNYQKTVEEGSELISNEKYQKLLGSLLFISINTRPDISASVCILAQKTNHPTQRDWNELKRILRYLKETSHLKLSLSSNDTKDSKLSCYVDASYAEDRTDRKSMTGYIFKLNGGTISWCSKKQQCVTLSSTEAELVAMAEACKEAIWISKLLKDINQTKNQETIIYEDNTSCLKMLTNEKISNRTKHIDIRYFYLRELAEKKQYEFQHCSTDKMIADALTKPLNATKLNEFKKLMNLNN